MDPQVSKRLQTVPASPIRKLVPYAAAAKQQGTKVYHLNIGDPDIKTPGVMIEALKNWDKNPIAYSQSQGQPEFIDAVKKYYFGLGYSFLKDENIQITLGGSEAISMTIFATTQPGDEILVFEPFYANYNSYAAVNGTKLVPILTLPENGFRLPNEAEIEKKITPKTRAILYCNPSNPTGTVYTKPEIEMLVKIAKKHGLFLISDEVYREFTYDGRKQVSLLDYMKEIPTHAIMLDSLSKRYSLCGARLGMLVSLNKEVTDGVLRIAQGRLSAGLIDQLIASKLTQVPPSYFKEVHDEYQKRRDILFAGLKKIPGVFVPQPEGAFYTIVKLPVKNAEDFAKWLLTDFRLNNETVMVAPAAGFYATAGLGLNEVRIAYVLNVNDLQKALTILEEALKAYNK